MTNARMIKKGIVLAAAFALASGWLEDAAAQRGELEVTMRVLDDASGVDAVLIAIDPPAAPAANADRETADARADDAEPAADARAESGDERFADREARKLDPQREDTEEGAIEDRDLAEDLEPTPEDPDGVAEE
jgi:hypothetical protein